MSSGYAIIAISSIDMAPINMKKLSSFLYRKTPRKKQVEHLRKQARPAVTFFLVIAPDQGFVFTSKIKQEKTITDNKAETSPNNLITQKTALNQSVSITAPYESPANTHSSLLRFDLTLAQYLVKKERLYTWKNLKLFPDNQQRMEHFGLLMFPDMFRFDHAQKTYKKRSVLALLNMLHLPPGF